MTDSGPTHTYSSQTLDQLQGAARKLLAQFGHVPCWLLQGPLGAGKTTLVKAICQQLGVQQAVTSPTFGLAQTYLLPRGEQLHHLDLYRLPEDDTATDLALDAGLDHYLTTGRFCLVEWPERVSSLWPRAYLYCKIEHNQETGQRLISAQFHHE